ncbi:MAG TPA: PEGA domain-containing protein [bacterium]|nr:PEGA domain-containing protein [bacterium]
MEKLVKAMSVLKRNVCGLLLALCVLALAAEAADPGRVKLTIQASPQSPPVKVWIDDKQMGETPLTIPGIAEGRHLIRVSRQGGSFERTVLIKSGREVILVANFLTNDFIVKNRDDLSYEPLQVKKTTVMITSSRTVPAASQPKEAPSGSPPPKPSAASPAPAAPAAPAAPEKEAPKPAPPAPAPKPAAEKPHETVAPPEQAEAEMAGDTGSVENPASECEPGQWCADPAEGEMGPPVPPEVRKNLELKKQEEERGIALEQARQQAEEEARKKAEQDSKKPKETTPAPSQPAPEKKTAPPCGARPGAGACASFGSDVRGVVNAYYCSLANHDFERAYILWSTSRDLAWFYNVSKSFCPVYDYRIEGFQAVNTDMDKAEATYVVSLLDQNGASIESWDMRTILIKRGGQWRIRSVSGRLVN